MIAAADVLADRQMVMRTLFYSLKRAESCALNQGITAFVYFHPVEKVYAWCYWDDCVLLANGRIRVDPSAHTPLVEAAVIRRFDP